MAYDIYDRDTGNLVDSFSNEQKALAMVARAVKEDGDESVASWALGPSDFSKKPLDGQELVARATQALA